MEKKHGIPPEFNIEPENDSFHEGSPFPGGPFSGEPCSTSGAYTL